MADIKNLSPLAFEILKYLCNTSTGNEMQQLDKDTLGIGSVADFMNALTELNSKGLIVLDHQPEYKAGSSVEDYTNEALTPNATNYKNDESVGVRIKGDNGDVCKDLDYYLEAIQDGE